MTGNESKNLIPTADEYLISNIKNLQSIETVLNEIIFMYNKCVRDGIKSSQGQGKVDDVVSNFYDSFQNIISAKLDDVKNIDFKKLKEQMNNLINFWFNEFIPCFTPKDFFALKVQNIISDLIKCTSSKDDGFKNNAQGEIDRFKYFEQQLSYTIGKEEVKPFPSISPIFLYNLREDKDCKSYFMEAISKSQDLAEQFQEFKDLWQLIKILSIDFEIFRVDKSNFDKNESSYLARIQFLSNAYIIQKNKH